MRTNESASEWRDNTPASAARPITEAHPPIVTVSAAYGAGGSVVGPRVAERLGVVFLDRAIPSAVAERLAVPVQAVAAHDEAPKSGASRLIAYLARVPVLTDPLPVERLDDEEHRYRVEIETFVAHACASGGVVLGRAGAVVLASVPGALHVRLIGPREARVRQAMELEGLDRQTAERRLDVNDRARVEYVRHFYGVNAEDPGLYHLIIDSGAVDLDTCVDVIVAASQSRVRQAARGGAQVSGPPGPST